MRISKRGFLTEFDEYKINEHCYQRSSSGDRSALTYKHRQAGLSRSRNRALDTNLPLVNPPLYGALTQKSES